MKTSGPNFRPWGATTGAESPPEQSSCLADAVKYDILAVLNRYKLQQWQKNERHGFSYYRHSTTTTPRDDRPHSADNANSSKNGENGCGELHFGSGEELAWNWCSSCGTLSAFYMYAKNNGVMTEGCKPDSHENYIADSERDKEMKAFNGHGDYGARAEFGWQSDAWPPGEDGQPGRHTAANGSAPRTVSTLRDSLRFARFAILLKPAISFQQLDVRSPPSELPLHVHTFLCDALGWGWPAVAQFWQQLCEEVWNESEDAATVEDIRAFPQYGLLHGIGETVYYFTLSH
ncbi:hypothetical protein JB92DRAFT_2831593 [Gautieria morchelliformis]|nr:hypothetical protein JB92DRAFT_2831593 [Gautieria morchelliformis]